MATAEYHGMGRDELADLVTETAREFAGRGLPLPDLIRAAQLRLAQAQQKFNQQSERTFEDYARWWIRRAIVRALPAEPGPPQEAVERMNAIIQQLQNELGYPPSVEEIAEAMYPVDRRDVWRQVCRYRRVTLADPLVDQEMAKKRRFTQDRVREYLGVETPRRAETAACQILRKKMEAALVELTAHEKEVMALRFGLDDGRPRTLGEVAESFGKTSEQIRQLEAKALRKLRQPPTDPR